MVAVPAGTITKGNKIALKIMPKCNAGGNKKSDLRVDCPKLLWVTQEGLDKRSAAGKPIDFMSETEWKNLLEIRKVHKAKLVAARLKKA